MAERKPIVDHYGTEIKVQPLMGSIGPCVDLERLDRLAEHSDDEETFDRLTLEQALELSEWLKEAVEAPR